MNNEIPEIVWNKISGEKISKDRNSVSYDNIDDSDDDEDISFSKLKNFRSKDPKNFFLDS